MKNTRKSCEKTVIRIEGLHKVFKLYKSKIDILKQLIKWKNRSYFEEVKALEDINIEVKKGESLGIVGSNGSGKSTLLQLICGTLNPTKGNIKVNGNIAALLELGSGFNPEFTGRENVYLNAILLGLSRKKVDEKIDKIIKFSEIGEFIDREVKFYSSGMIVRLAFAVIANVDADILIIDEALAVGDAYFTQKCMRFIQRFRKNGTVVFVSHDPNAVLSLCDRAILIENGKQIIENSAKKVLEEYTRRLQNKIKSKKVIRKTEIANGSQKELNQYIRSNINEEITDYRNKWTDYRNSAINNLNSKGISGKMIKIEEKDVDSENLGGDGAEIKDVTLRAWGKDENIVRVSGGEIVILEITCKTRKAIDKMIIGFMLKNDKGLVLLGDNSCNTFNGSEELAVGKNCQVTTQFVFTLPLLNKGKYSITASIAEGDMKEHSILHWVNDVIIIESECSSIAAGVAGIPMHSITIKVGQV